MKNHTEIAEKLNGKSIIRAAGEALRGRANCRIGVERESLRCTASGELAERRTNGRTTSVESTANTAHDSAASTMTVPACSERYDSVCAPRRQPPLSGKDSPCWKLCSPVDTTSPAMTMPSATKMFACTPRSTPG